MVKLNLGCGERRRDGFLGVDMIKTEAVDVVHDLRIAPWPFEADSVEEVYSAHFIEHLTGPERITFMNELGRVMQAGAQATIIAPYYSSIRAIQDPTHQWPPIAEWSFMYFNKGWRSDNKLEHYPITCDFDFTYGYAINPQWASRNHEAQAFAVRHYLNVVDDVQVVLTKR